MTTRKSSSAAPANNKRPRRTASDARWQGALEGLHEGLLYGWAVDRQVPEARVVVEICLDGEPFSSVIADVFRSDLLKRSKHIQHGSNDGCHGFVADIGALRSSGSGTLTARVANTDAVLRGNVHLDRPAAPPVAAVSHVFGDGGLKLFGWAVNPGDAQPVVVSAWWGTQKLAECTANQNHPAIRGHHEGAHGFELALPLALADGRVHEIRVLDAAGYPLNGSPLTVCCHAAGGQALLDTPPAALKHNPARPLLEQLLGTHERHLPRSVGLGAFAEWQALFEAAPATCTQIRTQTRSHARAARSVGILITGAGDTAAVRRSELSLKAQQGVKCQIFHATEGSAATAFARALKQALASGVDTLGCVRAGDTLPPHALITALQGFALSGARIVYTDCLTALPDSAPVPWFKPAWHAEYAYATDYPLELMLVDAAFARRASGAKPRGAALPENAAAWAWRMVTDCADAWGEAIVHVPHILYHRHSALTAAERAQRQQAAEAALKLLEPRSRLVVLDNAPADHNPRRLQRSVPRSVPRTSARSSVSLIIPTRDQAALLARCISSLQRHTAWPRLEIIVVDNGSVEAETKTLFRKLTKQGVRILPAPGPFNFARLNNRAVAAASGAIVGLINNDIEALHDGWLEEILSQLDAPGVGMVGAKLLWPNGMVQHGGVWLGVGNAVGHYGNRLNADEPGDHGRNQLVQQVSAVTAACLFMRRAEYLALGGMDESAFPVAFNDVDLCLRLRRQGRAIVWTPFARLLHAESASRGRDDTPQKRARAQRELDQLRARWGEVLLADPAYHPSLNLDALSQAWAGLALPPRDRRPRQAGLADGKIHP